MASTLLPAAFDCAFDGADRGACDGRRAARRTSAGALAAWQRGLMLRLLRVDIERRLRPARN